MRQLAEQAETLQDMRAESLPQGTMPVTWRPAVGCQAQQSHQSDEPWAPGEEGLQAGKTDQFYEPLLWLLSSTARGTNASRDP